MSSTRTTNTYQQYSETKLFISKFMTIYFRQQIVRWKITRSILSIYWKVKVVAICYMKLMMITFAGRITDSIEFKNDKIILSHNQGLYLYNDTLSILSIQHQTIHVYHILEGTFLHVRQIGRFCCDEEQFLYSSISGNTSRAFREPTINSLKHRILVYLFSQAKARYDAGDKIALRKFFQNFDQYLGLRMWKMQLLDEDHLLIKYSDEVVVTLKVLEPNSHSSFFVIYNIWEKKILMVHSNISEDLLYLFENFTDSFRNSKLSLNSQWTCSPSNNIYANLLHQRFKQTIISAKGEQ